MSNPNEARAKEDAEVEFEAVFLEHFPRVVGILTCLTGDRGRAEELSNEIFWKLYRRERKLLASGNVAGWLYRTATHAGIDAIRASIRRNRYERAAVAVSHGEPAEHSNQLQDLLRAEERARVQRVLAVMKRAQAQLILMRANGASYKELAIALGVAASSVGTLLNRAEAEFRKHYLQFQEQENKV